MENLDLTNSSRNIEACPFWSTIEIFERSRDTPQKSRKMKKRISLINLKRRKNFEKLNEKVEKNMMPKTK
jgi:hypothetical protein